jgi:sugar phosphate isomerase/epimerase
MSSSPTLSRRHFNRLFTSTLAGVSLAPSLFAAPRSPVPRLGCQTDLANAAAVKEAGGSFVGLSVAGWLDPDGPEDAFLVKIDAASSAPIPVIVCNSFIRAGNLKVTGPAANHDVVLAYCARAFSRAQRAGVGMITFGSGGSRRLPEGFEVDRANEQFIAFLQKLAPLAADHDVIVNVEQLQTRECNFLMRLGEVEHVVRAAAHPHIGMVADFYHMAAEGDTAADLAQAIDLVNHVEIAELEGRRVPGSTGQDFRPYLRVLKNANYAGAIGIEGRFELPELSQGFSEIALQWNEA